MEGFNMLLALLFSSLLQPAPARAASAANTIVDVRRNITLANDEEPYKDFYIAIDGGSGLKKNLVVTAVRKINVRDASGANAVGEITVPVGQLKIIAVYDKVAVAREFNLLSRDELPMLEQVGIMTGDKIETRGSFIDNSKPKKKKVAEAPSAQTNATTVAVAVTTAPPVPVTASTAPMAPAAKDLQASLSLTSPEKALAQAPVSTGEKLEKVADSGNNSGHE
ncbi:hypothetical protein B9G69_005400 [Bdellovibrio sp. SKB1291214]|uniref:hypothetical protein n=1 Tax=Bdellovibrio sp. SKB1291214 TaxID=1732569 RepID=UPI000B519D94|nr:hypothetical protein [Bdellovibrio sp. SKB1291214]UYL10011.1 hypothetical protein B9G69_005400 [Bdellovibrio sp. SKB1291214]